MFTKLSKMRLEKLKRLADKLDQRVEIYGNQFGPNDEVVLKLKNELYSVNQAILVLMTMEQEQWAREALID